MRQLLHSFQDLSEKTGTVFFLMFERIVLIVFGIFTVGILLSLGQDAAWLADSANQNIVFFSETQNGSGSGADTDSVIRRTIEEGIGYLLINYTGDPYVYVVGNYELALHGKSLTAPFAAYGSKIRGERRGDTFAVGDFTRVEIPIVDIDQSAVFSQGRKINLSDRILVVMDYDDYVKTFFHADLIGFLHVADPSPEQMKWIMEELNPDGLRVSASSVASYRETSFESMFGSSLSYFVLISLCAVFLCLHIFACETEIIGRKFGDYYVQRIYGCSKTGVFLRIFFTLIQIAIVPVVLVLLFGPSLLGSDINLVYIYAAGVVLFYGVVSLWFARYVERKVPG